MDRESFFLSCKLFPKFKNWILFVVLVWHNFKPHNFMLVCLQTVWFWFSDLYWIPVGFPRLHALYIVRVQIGKSKFRSGKPYFQATRHTLDSFRDGYGFSSRKLFLAKLCHTLKYTCLGYYWFTCIRSVHFPPRNRIVKAKIINKTQNQFHCIF